MIIECFKKEDIGKATMACIEYAREMGEPYKEEHIREMFAKHIGTLPILVAKKDAEIVGMSAFMCVPHLYNPDIIVARELIWHSSPKLSKTLRAKIQLRLLSMMMELCKKEGVPLHVSAENGKMLEKVGFKGKSIIYVKEF